MDKVVRRIELAEMPFDKFDNNQFVHATGYMVELMSGDIFAEYEDDKFVDAEDCVHVKEV